VCVCTFLSPALAMWVACSLAEFGWLVWLVGGRRGRRGWGLGMALQLPLHQQAYDRGLRIVRACAS
jgi:hypothetical protein